MLCARRIPSGNLRDYIVEELRSQILAGTLAVGEPLIERRVCEAFDVSLAPVREAFTQLIQEGFLDARPRRGVCVAPPAEGTQLQLMSRVRTELECYALDAVFAELGETPREWQRILDRLEKVCQRGDRGAICVEDFAYHRWIVRQTKLPGLLRTWTTATAQARFQFPQRLHNSSGTTILHAEHDEIADLCRRGQKKAALERLEANIADETL